MGSPQGPDRAELLATIDRLHQERDALAAALRRATAGPRDAGDRRDAPPPDETLAIPDPLLDRLPVPTVVWRVRGDTLIACHANPAAVEATAGGVLELMGQPAEQTLVRDPEILALIQGCQATRGAASGEFRHRMWTTGDERVLSISAYFLSPDRIITHAVDLTAKRRAEGQLATVFRCVPIGIGLVQGRVMHRVNPMVCQMLGYAASELEGRDARLLYPSDEAYRHVGQEMRRQLAANGIARVDAQWQRRDGAIIDVELVYAHVDPDDPESEVVATVMDVTERNRAARALAQSEAQFRYLFDHMVSGVALYRPVDDGQDFVFVDINGAGERICSTRREDVVGRRVTECFPAVEEIGLLELLRRSHRTGELSHLPVSRYDDGRVTLWVENTTLRLPDGTVAALFHDHSAEKRAEQERERLTHQLQHSAKMEAVGRLAGGVAHDFNNALTSIGGNASLAASELPEGHPLLEPLGEVVAASRKAAALTRQLLAFSRKQVIDPRSIDVPRAVGRLDRMLRRVCGEDVTLHLDLAPDTGPAWVDPGQLEPVIINLAINAKDAMPDGGTLTVSSRRVQVGEGEPPSGPPGLRPGPYVVLTVSDTGTGMDPGTRDRVFEPFFTTKPRDRGTGLGLATAYGILTQHGGTIEVASTLGQGSSFHLYLPATALDPETLEVTPIREDVPRGRETILVVEDEAMVRALTVRSLRRNGYEVLVASDGEEALDLVGQHTGKIDLLLTDVVMPGINGRELAERLTARIPGLAVLFTSGYPEEVIASHGILDPGVRLLPKPFMPDDLATAVRRALQD